LKSDRKKHALLKKTSDPLSAVGSTNGGEYKRSLAVIAIPSGLCEIV
jgi:hypothetical protein